MADPVWAATQEVESLTVQVLVDNITDCLSGPCSCCGLPGQPAGADPFAAVYTSEVARQGAAVRAGRAPCFDLRRMLHAGHGLSLLVTAHPAGGGRPRTVLFDAGPEAALWRLNAERMGVEVGDIEAVVLSHWHPDHSGGLPEVAAMAAEARSAAAASPTTASPATSSSPPASLVFDLHPRRPACRGIRGRDGSVLPMNPDPQLPDLEVPGVTAVELHGEAHTLCDGCFYVSGEIPRRTAYETGMAAHIMRWEEGGPWEPDPPILDERFLAARVRGKGAVVFSACSHAGIVNVLRAAQEAAGGAAPFAAIGGFHLSTPDMLDRIPQTVADLVALSPSLLVAAHCTGWRAQAALQAALPGRCMPASVGSTLTF